MWITRSSRDTYKFPRPRTALKLGQPLGEIASVRHRGGSDQEQSARPARSAHGTDRCDRHFAGEVRELAAGLLLDRRGSIGVLVDDQGLAPAGKCNEFVEVGVLDRFGAMSGNWVQRRPDAIVGISENEVAVGRRGERPL